MKTAAAPIPLRAEEPAGFTASRQNEPGDLSWSFRSCVYTRKCLLIQGPTLKRVERLERLEPVDS